MKRIHFTDEDLRNVRAGPTYGLLAETALSLERLVRTNGSSGPSERAAAIGFDGWREQVCATRIAAERAPPTCCHAGWTSSR